MGTDKYKPLFKEPEKFQERYRLYFHAVRYLLERVSWYCRDHKPAGDAGSGSAQVIFSNRWGMSYAEMRQYLNYLKDRTGPLDARIHWPAIDIEQITAFSPGKRMELQIADAVASGFFYVVQPSLYGYTEDRYARLLKPVAYHRHGVFQGYGVKFWPKEVDDFLKKEASMLWLKEYAGPGTQDPTR